MKRIGVFIVLISISLACAKSLVPGFTDLNANQLHEVMQNNKNIQLVDVRTAGEYAEGHIPGAINLEVQNDLPEFYAQLDKKKPVYVYCRSGVRSTAATEKLVENGFKVYNMKSGFLGWEAANLPKEK